MALITSDFVSFRLSRLSKLKELMSTYEDYLEPIMNGLILFKCFVILIVLGHMMACTWYYFGIQDEQREDNKLVHGWVRREKWGDYVTQYTRYVTAYTHVLTDWTIERSYTTTEYIVGFILHLTYEVFFGYLVGTMATIVLAGKPQPNADTAICPPPHPPLWPACQLERGAGAAPIV